MAPLQRQSVRPVVLFTFQGANHAYLRDAESIPYPGIRALVCQRIAELSQDDPFDPDTMGSLILVEPGDTAAQLRRSAAA